MSDRRRFRWRSGRLASTPINDGWALTRTRRDPEISNLPLEYAPRFRLALSSNFTDGTATTQQLTAGSGTFTAGTIRESVNASTIDVTANGYTELEWCIEATDDAEDAADYEFRVVVDGAALDTYTQTPTLTVGTAGTTVAVPAGTLALTAFAPTVVATANVRVDVPAGSLSLTASPPTVTASANQRIDVPAGALSLTGYAPTVAATANVRVDVPLATLTLTGFEPTVTTTANVVVDVPAASLTLTGYAPTVSTSADVTVDVPSGTLILTGYAPTVTTTANVRVDVPAASLTLTGYAPTVTTSARVEIPAASLTLTAFAPTVTTGGNAYVSVDAGALTLTGYPPDVIATTTAPTTAEPEFTGGFWLAFEREQVRKAAERRKRKEAEDEARRLAEAASDAVQAEIAQRLHEDARREAEAADLARLRQIVTAITQTDELSARAAAALAEAQAKQTRAALERFERELARQIEEEEFLLLAALTVDD